MTTAQATAADLRCCPADAWPRVAFVRRHPTVVIGGALLVLIVVASIGAPWLGTVDPILIDPSHRLRGRRPPTTGSAPTGSAATSTAA